MNPMIQKNKAAYFFMTSNLSPPRRLLAIVIIGFVSCAHYSTTQQNIKKANDVFIVKKDKTVEAPKPVQPTVNEQTGAIPLSQFLDSKTTTVAQSINPWFSRLQDWSRVYIDIAKSERDVRNYKLSEKYSEIGLMWAHRALQIKKLPTSGAVFKVRLWIDQLEWPNLPDTVTYFAAQDTYQKIYNTKDILKNFKSRFCLISHGIPIVPTLAYLDLSIDLFKQRKYSKALYKIQSGLAGVEMVKPEDDIRCEEKNENENESDDVK